MRAAGAESDRASFGRQKLTRVCVCVCVARQPLPSMAATTVSGARGRPANTLLGETAGRGLRPAASSALSARATAPPLPILSRVLGVGVGVYKLAGGGSCGQSRQQLLLMPGQSPWQAPMTSRPTRLAPVASASGMTAVLTVAAQVRLPAPWPALCQCPLVRRNQKLACILAMCSAYHGISTTVSCK